MPSINMEDNMKKKQIDLVQFTPEMNVGSLNDFSGNLLIPLSYGIFRDIPCI